MNIYPCFRCFLNCIYFVFFLALFGDCLAESPFEQAAAAFKLEGQSSTTQPSTKPYDFAKEDPALKEVNSGPSTNKSPFDEKTVKLSFANDVANPLSVQSLNTRNDLNDRITVNYPDQEIRVILRNIADLLDINLVIPETLIGRTSLKLRNVSWRKIFEIVLKPVGFSFTEEDNVVRVLSLEEINKEPMSIRTFSIKYAKAASVAKSLEPIIKGTGGIVQVDDQSNTLIVKDRPSALLDIENLLASSNLDKPPLQVMIETKFIEVSQNIGDDNDGFGLDWWSDGALFGGANNILKTIVNLDVFNNFPNIGSTLKTVVFGAEQYNMILRALETSVCSNLMANPTIVTLNNEKAEFHVGKNQPIIEANFDEITGNFTVGKVNYLPVGVRVDVTPRVNEGAEQITLNIHPKVSRINDFVEFSGTGNSTVKIQYPIEIIRETTTNVSIKDGYTIALGGLMQDDDLLRIKKVPLIGDIPFLGRVFQEHKPTKEKINLIMFITSKVLNPDGTTYHDIVDPRQIAAMEVSNDMIPGFADMDNRVPDMTRMSKEHKKLLDELQDLRNRIMDQEAQMCLKATAEAESLCEDHYESEGYFSKMPGGRGRREYSSPLMDPMAYREHPVARSTAPAQKMNHVSSPSKINQRHALAKKPSIPNHNTRKKFTAKRPHAKEKPKPMAISYLKEPSNNPVAEHILDSHFGQDRVYETALSQDHKVASKVATAKKRPSRFTKRRSLTASDSKNISNSNKGQPVELSHKKSIKTFFKRPVSKKS